MRLGLYIDAAFRADGGRVYSGSEVFGFMRFACAVGERFSRFALISRATDDPSMTPHRLSEGVDLVGLPYYPSLRAVGRVVLAIPATLRSMWRALDELDVVWVSGIHPLGLLLIGFARMRGRRVVLLIRQSSPRYFRSRLPGPAWTPLLIPLRALDLVFRLLGRRLPVTAVGAEVAREYGAPRSNVLEMHVALLERRQLAPAKTPEASGELLLLSVGRIAPEKNPLLAAELVAELEARRPGRYRLRWVGEGPLRAELVDRARELGVEDRLELPGYVPFGRELIDLYREADFFVHIATTEGMPGVLYEAMGSGLPVVATDVGGVAQALEGAREGPAGLLVEPGDAPALADAAVRLAEHPELRAELAARGLELAQGHTIEAESAEVAAFIAEDDRA